LLLPFKQQRESDDGYLCANQWSAFDSVRFVRPDSRARHHDSARRRHFRVDYPEGPASPGGIFGIDINGAVLPVIGGFTSGTPIVPNTGRVPTTLVVNVPLAGAVQTVTALWRGVRGGTVIIDSPAPLTALLD